MVGAPGDDPHMPGQVIGEMSWHKDGEIKNLTVQDTHQRRGIATTMYDIAKSATAKKNVALRHSPQRTDMGEAWAKSTGDPLPLRVDPNAGSRKHKADDSFGDFFNGK